MPTGPLAVKYVGAIVKTRLGCAVRAVLRLRRARARTSLGHPSPHPFSKASLVCMRPTWLEFHHRARRGPSRGLRVRRGLLALPPRAIPGVPPCRMTLHGFGDLKALVLNPSPCRPAADPNPSRAMMTRLVTGRSNGGWLQTPFDPPDIALTSTRTWWRPHALTGRRNTGPSSSPQILQLERRLRCGKHP